MRVTFPKEGDVVLLKGKDADIDSAIALFQENLEETITIKVPKNLHPAILGGGKIKDLNTRLGVVIRFPERESNSPNISVRGKASVLPEAEKALNEFAEEARARQEERAAGRDKEREKEPSDRHSETLTVKPEYVGGVIGRGGSNIRKVSDIAGVRIDIRKDSGEIVVSGSKDGVEFALRELRETINDLESRTTEVLHVNPRYHSRLAGKSFANLFKVQDEFNVTVKLPRNETDEVTVTGSRDDVLAAIAFLKESVKEIEFDLKQENTREDRPRRDQRDQAPSSSSSQAQAQPQQGRSGSRQTIQANDPFFAPPPQAQQNVTVWGARMS